jgi:hypothetical protein
MELDLIGTSTETAKINFVDLQATLKNTESP